MKNIPTNLQQIILSDRKVRSAIARQSHAWFFPVYFGHYMAFPSPEFHNELFAMTENNTIRTAVVVAFRGSAKSTLMTLSYPLWAIMGRPEKKFVLILARTMQQAKMYMQSIKAELESNNLLRGDLGPFIEQDEWGVFSLVIPKYEARIMCASLEQSIRGLRQRQHRPDLIICDDIETLDSVRTVESRDKTYQWFTGEVVPSGGPNTKIIVIGNLLHEDSLVMRLKRDIESGARNGVFRAYPFMSEDRVLAWPSKFSTPEAVAEERGKVGNESAWQREYMLRIVPDEGQLVHPEWIRRYDSPPEDYRFMTAAADLAVAQKETADYTAIVSAWICGYGNQLRIYILSNPINERLTFPETVQRIKDLKQALGEHPRIIVENVGYQLAIIQQLEADGLDVVGFMPHGQDKRARLSLITHLIQSGVVLFPKYGAEDLVGQLLGFGTERHDDLVDALVMLVFSIIESERDSGYTIPSITQSVPTSPKTEKEADQATILEQEYERQNFNRMMRRH